MNGRSVKVFHWHIVTWVHFIASDNSFKRPPCITLIQHQVGRLLRQFWGMSLARSFSWRGRINLDGWNGLDGRHVNHWVIQIYRQRSKFWDLRKRSLARLLLLRTSTTWKVTEVHWARNSFPFPYMDNRLLDDWDSGIVLDLDILTSTGNNLFLVFLHGGYSYGEEKKLNLKKKKRREEEEEEKWTTLTSTSSFFVPKIFCRRYKAKPQAARRPKVTRPWKDLSGKEQTWSIRSK